MADIKQIEVSGAVYDIKDQTARNQISAQNVTIAQQQTQINGAVTTANNANTTANNLASTVTANSRAISQLQGPARKYIMIGDSYGDGYSPDGSTTGWCDRVASYLGLVASTNYWSNHAGGACFGRSDNLSFEYLLDNVNVPSAERSSITDIVIAGGYNDAAWSVENINSGMNRVKTVVETKFPNAKVWVIALGWAADSGVRNLLGMLYDEAYSRTAHANKWIYNEVYEELQYKYYFSSDGIHPNENGQYLMSNCIAGILVGGTISKATQRQGFLVNGVNWGHAWRDGMFVFLSISANNLAGSFTVGVHAYTKIATVTNPYIMGATNTGQYSFIIPCIVQTSSDGFYSCALSATFKRETDGSVGFYVMTNGVNRAGSGYMPDSITGFQFGAAGVIIPIQVA